MDAAQELQKEARLLNRIIRWTVQGITWEPDPRHVEIVLQGLQLDDGKSSHVVTPGDREAARRVRDTPKGGEYLCGECNLVHAYDSEPVSPMEGLQPSTTSGAFSSKASSRCSTTSTASCRRTTGKSLFCSPFGTCSAGGRCGVESIHGEGARCSNTWNDESWSQVSPNVWRKVDMDAKDLLCRRRGE